MRKDVVIQVPVMNPLARALAPSEDRPTTLLERMVRASGVEEHGCPFCKEVFPTDAFIEHVPGCANNHAQEVT